MATLLACFLLGFTLIVVSRPPGARGFAVLPRRWVVDRMLGWFGRWCRLSRDYEHMPEVSEAVVARPSSASCSTALAVCTTSLNDRTLLRK